MKKLALNKNIIRIDRMV